MHIHIQALLHHYGYLGVFFILLLEMIGIPFPAETTLTISGFEWTQGVFRLVPLLVAASGGNIFGSTIAYGIGRFLGRPVIVRFGKYIGITNERLDKANVTFNRFQRPVCLYWFKNSKPKTTAIAGTRFHEIRPFWGLLVVYHKHLSESVTALR